jgi:prolyl-tRNA synthetase
MKQSKLFVKTLKTAPSDEVAKNAILLTRAGYIHKEMAGVYSFLTLGNRVLTKIENLIRFHMDKIGNEILMSSLAPKENWERTGRLEVVDTLFKTAPANENSKNKANSEYILNPTHEEIVTPIAKEYGLSYKDFPFAYYQIQTKFRNEARAKSGILRGREFRMKDLYSFHAEEKDFEEYYEAAKQSYLDFYKDVGLREDTYITSASGGDFTNKFSHEFQVVCEAGEDLIYIDKDTGEAFNKEVMGGKDLSKYAEVKACEVGNIFTLETKFTKAFDVRFTNEKGEKVLVEHMGCYGIGSSRTMGVVVEKFADEKGLVWPKNVSPFNIHLISLHKEVGDETFKVAQGLYEELSKGYEVLFDDREGSVGQKLNDADLLGITLQIIVGEKNLKDGNVEVKVRKSGEMHTVQKGTVRATIDELWPRLF